MEKTTAYPPAGSAGAPPDYGNKYEPAYTPAYTAQPAYTAPPQPAYTVQPAYTAPAANYGGTTTVIVTQPQYATPAPAPAPQGGWFERNQKNKPQSNSVGAAALVFITGGMNMAWSIGFNSYTFFNMTTHMRTSWFIGAIIGAAISAFLCNKIPRKPLILFAIALTIVDGIIFVSASTDYDAVIAARYIDGIANGLIFVPTMVLAGEEAVKGLRGMIASSIEMMCYTLGIFIQILYSAQWTLAMSRNFNVLQMQGVLTLIDSTLGLIIAGFLFVESPIFFLVRGQEEAAIDSLRRLQRPFVVTNETYAQLEDHKRYVSQNKDVGLVRAALQGLWALLKLCYFRAMFALGFSSMMYYAFSVSAVMSNGAEVWTFIMLGTLIFIGSLIAVFRMDSTGRKKPTFVGSLVCGGMALGVGICFDDYIPYFNTGKMTSALTLLLIYQFFAGFYTTASSAYLTEAFPLAIKPYYIALAFITQMVVEIIILSCDLTIRGASDFFYSLATFSFAFCVLAVLCLPETKQTTLSEAQAKFRRIFAPRMN